MITGAPSPTRMGSDAVETAKPPQPSQPPAADEQLIPAKAVEAKAIEAIGARRAVKPIRTEAVEAKPASLKPPVEAARRKMGKMTAPKSRASNEPPADPPMRAHEGERPREKIERGQGVGARSPHHWGKYPWQGLRRRNVKSNSAATPMSMRFPPFI